VRRLSALADIRALVAEGNFLLAEDIRQSIEVAGGEVIGPAASVERALSLIEHDRPDAAVLEVILADGMTLPVAEWLRDRQVPFVIVTGYARDALPTPLRTAPYVAKPFSREELIGALMATINLFSPFLRCRERSTPRLME
jgi:two-component SAPR family response regulator